MKGWVVGRCGGDVVKRESCNLTCLQVFVGKYLSIVFTNFLPSPPPSQSNGRSIVDENVLGKEKLCVKVSFC